MSVSASISLPPMFASVLAARTMLEYAIYVGAIIIVSAIVTLWIASSRLPLKQAEHEHQHRRSPLRRLTRMFGGGKKHDSSGRKRRRRREHRPRNPTLAETGGLPPVRRETSSASTEPYQD